MKMPQIQEFEIVTTDSHSVSCDGGSGALGHPKIYLEIAPDESEIICPYCSRKFVLEKSH